MGRLLAVVAALAGACLMGAEAFIPALPATGVQQQQQGTCTHCIGLPLGCWLWGRTGQGVMCVVLLLLVLMLMRPRASRRPTDGLTIKRTLSLSLSARHHPTTR